MSLASTSAARAEHRGVAGRAIRLTLGGVVALVGIAASSSVARAQTGPFFNEFGVNSRTGALGQAFTGLADDPSAAYYNPAGLGFAADETFIGWHYAKPDLKLDFVDPAETDIDFSLPSTRGMSVGSTSHLATQGLIEEFPWLDALKWGGVAFLSLPEINSFQSYADDTTPYFFRYDTRPDVLSIAISMGWRLLDWMSLGGGVMVTVSSFQETAANVRLPELICEIIPVDQRPAVCDTFPQPDPTKGLDLSLKQRLPVELTPVAGVLIKIPTPFLAGDTSLGFSYRGEIGNDFGTGPETTAFGYRDPETGQFVPILPPPGEPLPVIPVINFIGFSPQQYSVGMGLRPVENLTIGLDATYKVWDAFRLFQRQKPEPAFENTIVPRVGVEYRIPWVIEHWMLGLREFVVRGGYYYEPTPNPSLNGRTNVLDTDQHVISGGLGVGTRFVEAANFRTDLFYQYHLLMDRFTQNEGDPARGAYEIGGNVWSVGVEGSVDW